MVYVFNFFLLQRLVGRRFVSGRFSRFRRVLTSDFIAGTRPFEELGLKSVPWFPGSYRSGPLEVADSVYVGTVHMYYQLASSLFISPWYALSMQAEHQGIDSG